MRRVVGPDAAFLTGETPEWHFHVSALQILDPTAVPGFGFEALRAVFARRIHLIPQFRWKLLEPPLGLGWSFFVDDPDFDLDDHLHHVALGGSCDRYELGRLVGDLIGYKIDRRRPLWEAWFIEGLEGGRVAVLTKIHHSVIDGQSGVDVASALYDLTPEVREVPEGPEYRPPPLPSPWELSARNAVRMVGLPLHLARLGRGLVGQAVATVPRAFTKHAPAMPFQAPHTPFNGQLTPRRTFAMASLPLDIVKQVKSQAGVKVNDVVLAVCSGALRSYLQEHHELPVKPLVAQVPISTRTDANRSDIGTHVGSMFTSLATHLASPLDRLYAVRDSAAAGKDLFGKVAVHQGVGLTDALPPALFGAAARTWSAAHLDARTPPIYNVIISNVAGPPVDFYVAGARIESMYPTGPLLYGGGLNITVFSNGDTLDVGLITCRDLIPDPWPLADAFRPALDELADAVRPATRTRPRKSR